jgi:hypothetical protein
LFLGNGQSRLLSDVGRSPLHLEQRTSSLTNRSAESSLPPFAFKPDVPYVVALVELEEGPRLMANIVTADFAGVGIGEKVTAVYYDLTEEVSSSSFEPA